MLARYLLALLALLFIAAAVFFFSGGTSGVEGFLPAEMVEGDSSTQLGTNVGQVAAHEGDAAKRETVTVADVNTEDTVRLEGRVVHADLTAVADAEVRFVLQKGSGMQFELFGMLSPSAAKKGTVVRTDAAGVFAFSIEPGQKGYLQMTEDSGWYFVGQKRGHSVAGYRSDHSFGDLEVDTAASVAGEVRTVDGSPIAGAMVVVREGDLIIMRSDGREVDAKGRFHRGGLRGAKIHIRASASGYVPKLQTLTLEHGEHRSGMILELARGGSVAGVVVDDRGEPVVAAKVATTRIRRYGPGFKRKRVERKEAIETDSKGRFELSGLEGDKIELRIWADDHKEAVRVDVAVGQRDLVVELARLARIHGVLTLANGEPIEGSKVWVRTPETGQTVVEMVDFSHASHSRRQGKSVKTAADGSFSLIGIEAGNVEVIATGDHHVEAKSSVLQVRGGSDVTDLKLVAAAGASLDVRVVDVDGSAVEGAKVEVRQQKPAKGAVAGAFMMETTMHRFRARALGSGKSDADGRVRIGGLPTGPADVTVKHNDFVPAEPRAVALVANETASAELVVQPGGYLELEVRDVGGAPVAAARYVVKGPAGAEKSRSVNGKTDGEGHAKVGPLVAGSYKVELRLPQRPMLIGGAVFMLGDFGTRKAIENTAVQAQVDVGRSRPVSLTMPVLTRLHGVVHSLDGPVENAIVNLEKAGSGHGGIGGPSATTDRHGRYEITKLQAGEWKVRYGRKGAVVKHVTTVNIPPARAELQLDLTLGGGTLRLTVCDRDGKSIERARVSVEHSGDKGGQSFIMLDSEEVEGGGIGIGGMFVRTDAAGLAVVEGVPAGAYTIKIKSKGLIERVLKDVAVQGALTDLGQVTLVTGGVLVGEIGADQGVRTYTMLQIELLDEKGQPIKGKKRFENAKQGKFEITGLVPGSYRIRAQKTAGGKPGWTEYRAFEIRQGERTTIRL